MTYRPRLFAGIELDPHERERCAAIGRQLGEGGLHARFETRENLHLTIAFLGFVEPDQMTALYAAMDAAAAAIAPFVIALDRIGAFPHERKPRVVWIGPREQRPYRRAALAVRAQFEALGFHFDQPPIAHVTLARVKGTTHLPLIAFEPIPVRVGTLTLFESLHDAAGTHYEARHRTPLASTVPGRRSGATE